MTNLKNLRGFTIVELLIVIVVIAVLAAISVVAYNGIQQRGRSSKILSDMSQVYKALELYYAQNGTYPQTQSGTLVSNSGTYQAYVDSNCMVTSNPASNKRVDWVPNLNITLPQSDGNPGGGARGGDQVTKQPGCYMYQSDGTSYLLSAWNMLESPQVNTKYRRVGFREVTSIHEARYICNHVNIGGNYNNSYDISEDHYKFSYTFSNITNCNELPPAGA